jgi:DNA-binding Lrp family transcriptional regulator
MMDTPLDQVPTPDEPAGDWRVPNKAEMRASGQVQSLSRALKLLNALSHHPKGLPLVGIARLVGLPPSTAHRLLTTLQAERYVRFETADSLWQIGVQASRVGAAYTGEGERALAEVRERGYAKTRDIAAEARRTPPR